MSPAEKMAETFAAHGLDFAYYVDRHFQYGFLFSTPEFFVMGRPVMRGARAELIRDPSATFDGMAVDAWWVHGAVGNLRAMWDVMPAALPYLGFERWDDNPRFYPIETLRRLSIPTDDQLVAN